MKAIFSYVMLLWFILGFITPFEVLAKIKSPSVQTDLKPSIEVNSIEVLIKNSEFKKAKTLFKSINLAHLNPLDQVRYYFYQGMLAFESKKYVKALEYYRQAEKKLKFINPTGEVDYQTPIATFMAQSHFALNEFESAISALRLQKNRTEKSYLILSSSYWGLKKQDKAFDILSRALQKFPRSSNLIKQKALYFADLGLLHELYLEGQSLISATKDFDQTYFLFLVNLLKQKNELHLAKKLLEAELAVNPLNADITSELAYIYYAQNSLYPAKDLYLRAANLDAKYAYQAAEVLLKNNDLVLAKYFNSKVLDAKKKTKQRFALEIKAANFHEAYFLKDELNRQGLLEDESLIYALAYCAVKIGKVTKAKQYLQQIKTPEMFKKALKLKDWSQECAEDGSWKCLI